MFEFIVQNLPYLVIAAVGFFAAVGVFIYNLVVTKNFKKSFIQLKEDLDMIIPKKKREDYQTEFSPFVKDYILDKNTNELIEKETPRNVQAEIDSYKDVALAVQLAKLMPDPRQTEDDIDEYYLAKGDLDSMIGIQELADDYRDRFHLSEDTPFEEVIKYVDRYAAEQRDKLIKQAEDIKKTIEKEVKKDGSEKTPVEKEESQYV